MNEFNAGVRAAKERLADGAQMAYVLRRWCLHCSTIFDVPNRWRCCPACLPIEYADGENQSIEDLTRRVQLDDDAALEVLIGSDGDAFLVYASGRSDLRPEFQPAIDRLIAAGSVTETAHGFVLTGGQVDTAVHPHNRRSETVDSTVHVDSPTIPDRSTEDTPPGKTPGGITPTGMTVPLPPLTPV
ncbi:hypothetical protein ABLE94_02670 [Gordonia sp. VNK1]|uniref:hypothetical protein n=1 Tax=Gordonia oleivorans TaxID=3156618 RepID=UPI0032B50630